jgi:hypothetical protein
MVIPRKPHRRPVWIDPGPMYEQSDTEEEEALLLVGAI